MPACRKAWDYEGTTQVASKHVSAAYSYITMDLTLSQHTVHRACTDKQLTDTISTGSEHTLSTLLATTILTASSTVEYMSTSFIQMSSMLSNVSRRVTSYAAQITSQGSDAAMQSSTPFSGYACYRLGQHELPMVPSQRGSHPT